MISCIYHFMLINFKKIFVSEVSSHERDVVRFISK